MLLKLMGYVKSTTTFGVHATVSHVSSNPILQLYCDADLAGDPTSSRSHSGTFIVLWSEDGTFFPLAWSSKRQGCVSRSTTEAEIVAAAEVVYSDGLPLLDHLEKVLSTKVVSQLCEDNSAAVTILKSGFSAKLRHMNRTHRISIAGLSELIESREIELKPTKTEDQLADIATKPLCRAKFLHARKQLQVVSSEQIEELRAKRVLEHTAH